MMLRPIATAKCPNTIGKYSSIYYKVTLPFIKLPSEFLRVAFSQVVPVFLSSMQESLPCSSTLMETAFDLTEACSELSMDSDSLSRSLFEAA